MPFFRRKPPEFRGYVDSCHGGEVSGWVWDRLRPKEALRVEVFSAGVLIGSSNADLFRADLAANGIGTAGTASNSPCRPEIFLRRR